jgi:hypothetical protein
MDSGKKKRTRKEYEREKKEEGPREGIPEREQEPLYEEGYTKPYHHSLIKI